MSLNLTASFLHRFEDLEPMLILTSLPKLCGVNLRQTLNERVKTGEMKSKFTRMGHGGCSCGCGCVARKTEVQCAHKEPWAMLAL